MALFLATVTVWLLSLTADLGAAADNLRTLAESPAFVTAALGAQLGSLAPRSDPLGGLEEWQKLLLRQSPALAAGVAGGTEPRPGKAEGDGLPETALSENDDPEDLHDLPSVAASPGEIVGKTILPVSGSGYAGAQGVYIENQSDYQLDVAALASAPLELALPAEGPQVLIVHTHGTEAYTPDGEDQYLASGDCRTTDLNYSVVRVGEEIRAVLTEMGLQVLHDTTLHDYPLYSGAYDRSLETVEGYLAAHPSIQVVLDVHRDALIGEDGTIYKPITTVNGEKSAQVMLVMGSDAKYSHPDWLRNLSLAVKVQKEINTLWPTLARPICLRTNRFNQQLSAGALLVEIGSHGNTLQEALAAARMFARSAGAVLLEYRKQ